VLDRLASEMSQWMLGSASSPFKM